MESKPEMGCAIMIKLYTYQKLLLPENRRQIHPLLFDLHYFENTHPSVHQHYQLVDQPHDADAFIFPIDYLSSASREYHQDFKTMRDKATEYGKKMMVYTGGDYGKTFHDPSIIPWRNAGFKSMNDQNTIVVPSFINDPIALDEIELQIHEYELKPKISFTGFATGNLKESLRSASSTIKGNILRFFHKNESDYQISYNAAGKRYHYLKLLEHNEQIITDFIYRDAYRAGATTDEERIISTLEFFKNLNSSPYVFCLRGAGNFSVRFYEALALGKIPVLMDTDVQLPLEGLIPWDDHLCRVGVDQDLTTVLLNFHKSHNDHSFKKLQEANRKLYENYLVRHAYFCHLHDHLKSLL